MTIPIHPDFLAWLKKHRRGIGLACVFPTPGSTPTSARTSLGHAGDDAHLISSHHDIDVLRGAVGAIASINSL